MTTSYLFSLFLQTCTAAAAIRASTPQMGWNSWNTFKYNFTQTTIEQTTDLLVSLGLRDAGYSYVVMDAGWQAYSRDNRGRQQANASKIPDGVASIANYVHQRNLKFGLYSDTGTYDCGFYPGSWGYEELDAKTYAEWGIDYLKYDFCGGFHAGSESPQVRFNTMRDALLTSGRDIFYSLCEWGHQFPWFWADQTGHSYRMSGDITATFSDTGKDCACKTAYCLNTGYAGCSVLTIIRKMRELAPFQSPGSFADMDMLEIGNGNFTLHEQRTHMAFWAALKSPLIIGADISKLSNDSLAVLKNHKVIEVNQDSLGKAALFLEGLSKEKEVQVWAGPLSGKRTVVLIFNEKVEKAEIRVQTGEIPGLDRASVQSVLELWSGSKNTVANGTLGGLFEPHETKIYII